METALEKLIMGMREAQKNIIKFRGDTCFDEFELPDGVIRLEFLVRNDNGMPILYLNSEEHGSYLSFDNNTNIGFFMICDPSADNMLQDTNVFIEPNGIRRLFYAIGALSIAESARRLSSSAQTYSLRTIVRRGDYILFDDVLTGGAYNTFMPPSYAFEGLPYAILRALAYATLVGVSAASQMPDQIITLADAKRAEIAATIRRMKEQGVLPVAQEFETIPITPEIAEIRQVTLKAMPRRETVVFSLPGMPSQGLGIDYEVQANVIDLKFSLKSFIGLAMNVSYLVQ